MFFKYISFILFSLVTITNSLATPMACLHDCHVFTIGEKESSIVLSANEFRVMALGPLGERQLCMAKKEVSGDFIVIEISDILSSETTISARVGSKLIAASSFSGDMGTLSVYSKNIRITCQRR
ncbi:hypothetical protein [Bacteriovorax sp. Seq25_V]|uniref:hypothetical protein n=1 Tax=Bacteriovorax sp. Seq25_V TaxID=1201288 RepID=UPI00038A44E0|nr:hypothetical protein [Bacteriovorax sp. Seq25_V]EQC44263.1 hypothetical protein M900_A0382 [Bacteriovorax sp. Seq25_V]